MTPLGWIILFVLLIFALGTIPTWGYSRNWGYGPTGLLWAVLVIAVLLTLTHHAPWLAY